MRKAIEEFKNVLKKGEELKKELIGEKVVVPIVNTDKENYEAEKKYGALLIDLEHVAYRTLQEILYDGFLKHINEEKTILTECSDSFIELKERVVFYNDKGEVIVWFRPTIKSHFISFEITEVEFIIYALEDLEKGYFNCDISMI